MTVKKEGGVSHHDDGTVSTEVGPVGRFRSVTVRMRPSPDVKGDPAAAKAELTEVAEGISEISAPVESDS